jgi:hypothetical protein
LRETPLATIFARRAFASLSRVAHPTTAVVAAAAAAAELRVDTDRVRLENVRPTALVAAHNFEAAQGRETRDATAKHSSTA